MNQLISYRSKRERSYITTVLIFPDFSDMSLWGI